MWNSIDVAISHVNCSIASFSAGEAGSSDVRTPRAPTRTSWKTVERKALAQVSLPRPGGDADLGGRRFLASTGGPASGFRIASPPA